MKNMLILLTLPLLSVGVLLANPTLTEKLQEKANASNAKLDPNRAAIMQKAITRLDETEIIKNAVKKGDTLPQFTLPDVKGNSVRSEKLLENGPLVVTFYRGVWCPYCSLQLRDLQEHLLEIKKAGAELVAISPQTPDNSLSTVEKNKLEFFVLSDQGGKVARQFGLMYELPTDLVDVYKGFGLDLMKINGSEKWELPIAATYVVNSSGKIVYSFLDSDYKKRAETKDIIKILKSLK